MTAFPKKICFFLQKNFNPHEEKYNKLNIIKKYDKKKIAKGKNGPKNWSREIQSNNIIFLLSMLGTVETLYLFFSKFYNSGLVCNFGSCSAVLDSPFSNLFGIPVSFLGFLFYFQIFLFVLEKINFKDIIGEYLKSLEAIFFGFLFVFFGFLEIYFSFIMEFVLRTTCEWCNLSIIIFFGILVIFFLKQNKQKNQDKKEIIFLFCVGLLSNYLGNMVELEYFFK